MIQADASATNKGPVRRLLVANRGEIAIRVLRAANELGMATVAIYAQEDRFSLHRFKADESYRVGRGQPPIQAYLAIDDIVDVALQAGVDAVHPGYGFLAENPAFATACRERGLIFVGPEAQVMATLGDKVSARRVAEGAGVAVIPATGVLPEDLEACRAKGAEVGYPVMLKASWGGGGRGMRVVNSDAELVDQLPRARREAKGAFGRDEVYLEKLIRRARHVEVQILGDVHGNVVHLFERDCSIQRRHQKVVERAPAPYLDAATREAICQAALAIARSVRYTNAGTVEFLLDRDSGAFYFIEVNPRIQVEHTVTEEVTGIDIVKAQLKLATGARLGDEGSGVPRQENICLNGHALQCRVTTEDPTNQFMPDYGRIRAYRGATGFGIRLDGGTAYSGALITPFYDSLLEKVTAWAPDASEAIDRMGRALREFRIRGVTTNLAFLENVISHPKFRAADYTTTFIDDTKALFQFPRRRDRATRLLGFLAEVIVNGNPEVAGRPQVTLSDTPPPVPSTPPGNRALPPGTRDQLKALGPEGFARWLKAEERVLITDTTMRDAHQSLFATRMRSIDLWNIAPAYAHHVPTLLSLECWGGATFDVAMRFLKEDPWERLAALRERIPNIPFQMLLRSANAVGYTNYPDNVVRHFVQQAARAGVDIFRVFDALNNVDNMTVAMEAVIKAGGVCEGAICYSGDLGNRERPKYQLDYYIDLAVALEARGAHILAIKDMAGLCKPRAAHTLVTALKDAVDLPIHFHTHDTSGISGASVLAAIDAGVDAVDAAMDAMGGLTSQPPLGSLVAALQGSGRDTQLDATAIDALSRYWEGVRGLYAAFESPNRAPTADVYHHEMPGGQYTNLKEQARSLGLEARWDQVSTAYAQVNQLFGDIVKVTPTSKVVGDMALAMVTADLTPEAVLDPQREVAFPASVVSLFKGELGFPPEGFPKGLQDKVLKGESPLTDRPGALLEPVDLEVARNEVEAQVGRAVSDQELASYLLYPKVFVDYVRHRQQFGNVAVIPTKAFFYGLSIDQEIDIDIDRGKTLVIRYLGTSEPHEDGEQRVFFELNGQPRLVTLLNRRLASHRPSRPKAEEGNPHHVAAPMPGLVIAVAVTPGQRVAAGAALVTIEAMKMETVIRADGDAVVDQVVAPSGTQVDAKDLLVVLKDA